MVDETDKVDKNLMDSNNNTTGPKKATRNQIRAALEDILRRVDELPILDPRQADELLGYGEDGLPH